MKKGAASISGSREITAAPNSRPMRPARASSWQARIASSMKNVATTCAKCHEEPAWAEYQTIVPNAKTSASTMSRAPRRSPSQRRSACMTTTFAAPSRIDAHAWSKSGPKSSTAGSRRRAGIGG